jgi:hypothetical protein
MYGATSTFVENLLEKFVTQMSEMRIEKFQGF